MTISQDTFNKLVTVALTLFFMGMFIASFITGKPLDVQNMIAFLIPTLNHIVHQITGAQVVMKNLDAATTVSVVNATNGNGNGNGNGVQA